MAKSQRGGEAAPRSKPSGDANPEDLVLEKLKDSGLEKCKGVLGVKTLSAKETERRGFEARVAMEIPYFSPAGTPTGFYRLRYLGKPRGFAADANKERRYVQPKDSLNEPYFPRTLKQNWLDVLKDAEVPVYFTEGEFKAAKGCAEGLATIGLGGVEMWRAGRRGFPALLPGLEEVKWSKRPVAVLWDSDVVTKPAAMRAGRLLAGELAKRGAFPRFLALPAGRDGKKVGLDDFLLTRSAEELKQLVNESPLWEEAEALWKMNEEVVLIRYPTMVAVQHPTDSHLISPKDFNVLYADRKIKVVADDDRPKAKPLAKAWLEWPERFVLNSVTYAPGEPRVTVRGEWNTWTGWGVEAKRGDTSPWDELLDFIFKEHTAARDWFEKWAAYPIQHPGAKLFSAVVIWGVVQGTGKTLLGLTLKDIYGRNGVKIGEKQLHGNHNEWAKGKQFVLGEEMTGKNVDKRELANELKDLITGEEIIVNEKFIPAYSLPNRINFYFTSNSPNAFFLEDFDRRYFIHEVVGSPAPVELYRRYDAWRMGGGTAALRYRLERVSLEGFDPKGKAYETVAKEEMIISGKTDMGRWCWDLKLDPTRVLTQYARDARVAKDCDLYSTAQLHHFYNPEGDFRRGSVNGFGRELKAVGLLRAYRGMPLKTRAGPMRLWVVRNANKWLKADGEALRDHWESFWCVGKKY